MSCPDTQHLETSFVLGELAPRDHAHLQDCTACAAQIADLRALGQQLARQRAPAGFAATVMAGVRSGRARRRWPWAVLGLAALVLLGLGGLTLLGGLTIAAPATPPGGSPAEAAAADEPSELESAGAHDPRLALELPQRLRVGDCLAGVLVLTMAGSLPLQVSTHVEGSAFDLRAAALQLTPSGQELPLTVTAREAGTATLVATVQLQGDTLSLRRSIEVEPAGSAVELVSNLSLAGLETHMRAWPHPDSDALRDPRSLALRLIPGVVAEAHLSLRGLVRRPHGCFEQTSAATFPSLLVLAIASARSDPDSALVAAARTQARAGAERLRRFQMPDGGFSLHGRTASDPWLTAYGLRELVALARYLQIEPERVSTARAALLSFQQSDGSFPASPNGPDPLAFSAYALHALLLAGGADQAVQQGCAWLEEQIRQDLATPYGLALSARLFLDLPDRAERAEGWIEQLLAAARRGEHGLFWPAETTWTRSSPRAARVELTALAAQVLFASGRLDAASDARAWLIEQRTADGFGGSQATVQALRAFELADSGGSLARGLLDVAIAGRLVARLPVEPDLLGEHELVISGLGAAQTLALARQRGIELSYRGAGVLQVQLLARGWLPAAHALRLTHTVDEQTPPALHVRLTRPASEQGQSVVWRIFVENQLEVEVNNPMLELDLPAGFALDGDGGLDALLAAGSLQHWERWSGSLVLYLQDLAPHQSLRLDLRLMPGLAGDFLAPALRAYPYYRPGEAGLTDAVRVVVAPRRAPRDAPAETPPESTPVARRPEPEDNDPEEPRRPARERIVGSEEPPALQELRIAWGSRLPDLSQTGLLSGGNGPLARLVARALFVGVPGCVEELIEVEPGQAWNAILKLDTWSDGRPLSADDFARSWEQMRQRRRAGVSLSSPDTVQLALLDQLEWQVLAFNMLEVRSAEPRDDLIARLGAFPFLPLPDPDQATISSNGPYRIESFSDEELLLRARDPGLQLQRIRIRPAGSFEEGPADLHWQPAGSGVLVYSEDEGLRPLDDETIRELSKRARHPLPTELRGTFSEPERIGLRHAFAERGVILDFDLNPDEPPKLVLVAAQDLPILLSGSKLIPEKPYDRQMFVRWPLKLR